jgi:hypothetical protein
MAKPDIDESRLKELFKEALVEVLEERQELMRAFIEEALEDIALARAIEEGEGSPAISRDEVFRICHPARARMPGLRPKRKAG